MNFTHTNASEYMNEVVFSPERCLISSSPNYRSSLILVTEISLVCGVWVGIVEKPSHRILHINLSVKYIAYCDTSINERCNCVLSLSPARSLSLLSSPTRNYEWNSHTNPPSRYFHFNKEIQWNHRRIGIPLLAWPHTNRSNQRGHC